MHLMTQKYICEIEHGIRVGIQCRKYVKKIRKIFVLTKTFEEKKNKTFEIKLWFCQCT